MATDVEEYREYVAAGLDRWRRTAYLLSGDWHLADDLVSTALIGLLRHWRRVSRMENPEAYVRKALLRALLNERRRPWRRERPTEWLPDRAGPDQSSSAQPHEVVGLLAELPVGRRAVLVLRFFCDQSVEETAALLGCSTGNVKSQTSRGLETLRTRLGALGPISEEV